MKPLSIFRTLSMGVPARLSAFSAGAPLPIITPFHHHLTAELVTLLPPPVSDQHWLCHALDASINTQKIALESVKNTTIGDALYRQESSQKSIEEYLDGGSIKLLDSCNEVLEKIQVIHEFVKSLKVVLHLLHQGKCEPSPITSARARNMLEETCDVMERRMNEDMKNHKSRSGWSSLKKLSSRKKLAHYGSANNQEMGELGEILKGSKDVASVVCQILGLALSSKSSKHSLITSQYCKPIITSSWSCSLRKLQNQVERENNHQEGEKRSPAMLSELQQTMALVGELRRKNHIGAARQRETVEELDRSCGKLEDEIRILEKRVRDLYRHLVSVRMALLGILSQP
ncbi:PREDICTED: uncharacterized protein LOC105107450 [Populus euphratica]|uniref:Uncharacterized protein LOC105107450 n=1 Tax=Populus euphratica TaxID=75702 RepID=A0AAJ6SVC1_POPEU|nr:PREDICTED: uncharacterized protein LOC105107450 [Populus euphratica]